MIPTTRKLYDHLNARLHPGQEVNMGVVLELGSLVTPLAMYREKAAKELVDLGHLRGTERWRMYTWHPEEDSTKFISGKAELHRLDSTKNVSGIDGMRGEEIERTIINNGILSGIPINRDRLLLLSPLLRPLTALIFYLTAVHEVIYPNQVIRFGYQLLSVQNAIVKAEKFGLIRAATKREPIRKLKEAISGSGAVGTTPSKFYALGAVFEETSLKQTAIHLARETINEELGPEMLERVLNFSPEKRTQRVVDPSKRAHGILILERNVNSDRYATLLSMWAELTGMPKEDLDRLANILWVVHRLESERGTAKGDAIVGMLVQGGMEKSEAEAGVAVLKEVGVVTELGPQEFKLAPQESKI